MKKAGKIHYLESGIFSATGITAHGFTTRHEGVSRHPYNSLNLGNNTFDLPHNVQGNRSILARSFGRMADHLVTVNQVHGVDLLIIDTPNQDYSHFLKLECDGIITNQKGVIIGISVADCVPLLLLDPVKRVVAALHAGWKGTAGNIAKKGVETMTELFGSRPVDIMAAIGPAIGSCCYEVDSPVRDAFLLCKNGLDCFNRETAPGKWNIDLKAGNRQQLLNAGISETNIDFSERCVSCEQDLFFSFRRDKGETGRQMGFIMLK